MSEPIDSYGATWPRPEPRDGLTRLRAELRGVVAGWLAVAETDSRMLANPAFTEFQRERLRGAASALRRCARELREVIEGAA